MTQIPTAKEFYDAHYSDDAVVIMRDFAKLHVEAALKNVVANINVEDVINDDNSSILNAYPMENIK